MEKKQKMLFSMQKRSFDGNLDNPGAGLIKIDQVGASSRSAMEHLQPAVWYINHRSLLFLKKLLDNTLLRIFCSRRQVADTMFWASSVKIQSIPEKG